VINLRHVDAHSQCAACEKTTVVMPSSKLKVAIAEVLKDEGYVDGFSVVNGGGG